MRYFKWAVISLVIVFVAGFLHYTLPRHDVVRIIDTYQQRTDLTGWTRVFWSGSTKNQQLGQGNRDVQFIQAVRPDGKTVVYRNEDTSWGWPPYFKFDTATLQARATDLKSTSADPKWVSITRYGWRNEFLSAFPNAMAMKSVDGPDATIVPWFNIFFVVGLIVMVLLIRTLWKLFHQRFWQPFLARWK